MQNRKRIKSWKCFHALSWKVILTFLDGTALWRSTGKHKYLANTRINTLLSFKHLSLLFFFLKNPANPASLLHRTEEGCLIPFSNCKIYLLFYKETWGLWYYRVACLFPEHVTYNEHQSIISITTLIPSSMSIWRLCEYLGGSVAT